MHRRGRKGARLICDWLESEGTSFGNPAAEQIIDEARRILYGAELEGTLPKDPPPPPGTPASEIIPRCRPKQDQDGSDIAHYARWLAIWSYYVYPDPVVRDRALNIALRAEIRGDRSALSP